MHGPRITNLDQLGQPIDRQHGTRFASRHFRIAPALGARKLGYNVTEVPPGRTAFPYHFHHVNEELFLILEGQGTLRWPGGTHPLRAGDLICCPPGPEGAHQILNTGSIALRYLAISTMEDPEVAEYPDSGKYGVLAGRAPGGRIEDSALWVFAFKKDGVDYWAGEGAGAPEER
jgi:uncharacterized cupin superfamily protein